MIDLQNNEAQPNDNVSTDKADLPDCNCKWTCGSYLSEPIACSHTDYKKTVRGCGLLGMRSCTGRDEIDSANCN